MDHTSQSAMLMPASYAVLSEEEMTYLDGGADYSFNIGDYTVTFHPEVLGAYAMNLVVNTFKEGLMDGLTVGGVIKHNWNRMNNWSRAATVGMSVLGGYYVYVQAVGIYKSLKNLFGAIVTPSPAPDAQDPAQANGLLAA